MSCPADTNKHGDDHAAESTPGESEDVAQNDPVQRRSDVNEAIINCGPNKCSGSERKKRKKATPVVSTDDDDCNNSGGDMSVSSDEDSDEKSSDSSSSDSDNRSVRRKCKKRYTG